MGMRDILEPAADEDSHRCKRIHSRTFFPGTGGQTGLHDFCGCHLCGVCFPWPKYKLRVCGLVKLIQCQNYAALTLMLAIVSDSQGPEPLPQLSHTLHIPTAGLWPQQLAILFNGTTDEKLRSHRRSRFTAPHHYQYWEQTNKQTIPDFELFNIKSITKKKKKRHH